MPRDDPTRPVLNAEGQTRDHAGAGCTGTMSPALAHFYGSTAQRPHFRVRALHHQHVKLEMLSTRRFEANTKLILALQLLACLICWISIEMDRCRSSN